MASQRLPPSLPSRTMSGRYFYGWNVVAATFVMALFSFGLGFYGLSVYVATLQRIHGWSASAVSAPVTVYYVAGAAVNIIPAPWFERRRGLAVSVAFNGATLGGVTLTSALILYRGGRGSAGAEAEPGRSELPRGSVPSTGRLSRLCSADPKKAADAIVAEIKQATN